MTVRAIFSPRTNATRRQRRRVSAVSPFPRILRPGRAPLGYSCPPRLYSARFFGRISYYTGKTNRVKRVRFPGLHLICIYVSIHVCIFNKWGFVLE